MATCNKKHVKISFARKSHKTFVEKLYKDLLKDTGENEKNLLEQIDNLHERIDDLEAEIDDYQGKVEELEAEVDSLQEELQAKDIKHHLEMVESEDDEEMVVPSGPGRRIEL